jgi:hypothetical protein
MDARASMTLDWREDFYAGQARKTVSRSATGLHPF